jgi:beta-galactosidase
MKSFIVCVVVFASLSVVAQSRKKINFDNDWKFTLGHAADASKDFNYSIANIFAKSGKAEKTAIEPKFDDKAWDDVTLPHDWVVALPFENSPNFDVMAHGYKPVGGLYPQNSIGWYRKHFMINKLIQANDLPSSSMEFFAMLKSGVMGFTSVITKAAMWV